MNVFNEYILIGNEKGVLKVYDIDFTLKDMKKLFYDSIQKIIVEENFIICFNKNEAFVV